MIWNKLFSWKISIVLIFNRKVKSLVDDFIKEQPWYGHFHPSKFFCIDIDEYVVIVGWCIRLRRLINILFTSISSVKYAMDNPIKSTNPLIWKYAFRRCKSFFYTEATEMWRGWCELNILYFINRLWENKKIHYILRFSTFILLVNWLR